MKRHTIAVLFAASIFTPGLALAAVTHCSDEKVAEVLEPATATRSAVEVQCHLTLRPNDVVTKRILLTGRTVTGAVVDCGFATLDGGAGRVNYKRDMVEVRSRKDPSTGAWERPENVTIKDCNITGSVRVYGMSKNGSEGAELRAASRQRGINYISMVRGNAPTQITLKNLAITGVGRTPVYFAPGVTWSNLLDSELKGHSDSVAVYLDSESGSNAIRKNYIHTTTNNREVMAIDGSDHNRIMNNRFSALSNGGIFLYRNCGKGGIVRHNVPYSNWIVNNVFYYDQYRGPNPSVFLGSRNGNRDYCDADAGYGGSGSDDRDFAQNNRVLQNQIYKRSVADMIKTGSSVNNPNLIAYNETVSQETPRLAGCYVENGFQKDFIQHGEKIDVFMGNNWEPVCLPCGQACNDGELSCFPSTCDISDIDRVPFECQVQGNNAGCKTTAECPSGKRIIAARAACNLEFGAITDQILASLYMRLIRVVRASDKVSDGSCHVGVTRLGSGQKTLDGLNGLTAVEVGCKENDANGGDCHVRGALYCR